MEFRLSTLYAWYLMVCLAAVAVLATHAVLHVDNRRSHQDVRRRIVKDLALTDLVLFTDARYTRHPAMADRHTPFQDHPVSLEHFPSGTLIAPPRQMRSHGTP